MVSLTDLFKTIPHNCVICDKRNLTKIVNHFSTKHIDYAVLYHGEGDYAIYFDESYGYDKLRERLKGIDFTIDNM